MPKLDEWCMHYGVRGDWSKAPELWTPTDETTQHLNGRIYDDKRFFRDGERVTTSAIKGKRGGKVVTKSGTEYELLESAEEYEKEFPGARQRLMDSLPEIPEC